MLPVTTAHNGPFKLIAGKVVLALLIDRGQDKTSLVLPILRSHRACRPVAMTTDADGSGSGPAKQCGLKATISSLSEDRQP